MNPDPLQRFRVIREPGTTRERVWYEATSTPPILAQVQLSGKEVAMEVDTGA